MSGTSELNKIDWFIGLSKYINLISIPLSQEMTRQTLISILTLSHFNIYVADVYSQSSTLFSPPNVGTQLSRSGSFDQRSKHAVTLLLGNME